MAKKVKPVSFQTKNDWEKEIHEYGCSVHNFSGLVKRIISESEGFKEWKRKKKIKPTYTSNNQGGIKITL
ncbi:hypothetical protein NSA56_11170 [Oceanobacillus caeni]|uniref:hypothetical protein n=1 Tax=Oceanobacillus caeni TaxID=405946 RepID=UPI002149F599|nr:hypothetical protein [Oceanobacillus caeni]MCR1834955.1 hypothetical protein [Oceanobacillus caeni]